jgi:hypothetical protein
MLALFVRRQGEGEMYSALIGAVPVRGSGRASSVVSGRGVRAGSSDMVD